MASQIPVVDYLVLDADPHLVVNACVACGARFFDRRNACASCAGTEFRREPLGRSGKVRSFTIVHRAAPGVPTPYVSALVDLDGGMTVKSNIVNTDPTPEKVRLGMPVRLTTFVVDSDSRGVECVAFGFEPAN